MKITEYTEREFRQIAGKNEHPIFCFLAPNFEERSLGSALQLSKLENSDANNKILALIVTLQREQPPEILDAIKSSNRDRCQRLLESSQIDYEKILVHYPSTSYKPLFSKVIELMVSLGDKIDLAIDISALPRNLLFMLLEYLFPPDKPSPQHLYNTKVHKIYFLYTWACRYPIGFAPELLGGIKGYLSGEPLHRIVDKNNGANLVVVGSGGGHDAIQTLNICRNSPYADKIVRRILFYIHRDRVAQSYVQFSGQQALFIQSEEHNNSIGYVFSPVHAYTEFLASMPDSGHEDNRYKSFIIAPFGPKPLALFAYFALREYKSSGGMGHSDILDHDEAQYLSVYSIGSCKMSVYSLASDEIEFVSQCESLSASQKK